MKRRAFKTIRDWSIAEDHPPLIIRGARQVGKSYLVRWLGQNYFKSFIEINFEKRPDLKSLFKDNNLVNIISSLEVIFNTNIVAGETLLFFDEVQACPEVLSSLRWFAEDYSKLHVIATGSLLDFALAEFQSSMPVGRVTFMFLEPFSFFEFAEALGEKKLVEFLNTWTIDQDFPSLIHQKALMLFKQYLFVGGMPKAIKVFRDKKSFLAVERIHLDLLESFKSDFNKYKKRIPIDRLLKLFDSITKQLGQKFVYSKVDIEEKSQAIKQALELLLLARIGFKTQASSCNGIPLGAEIDEKVFKIFFIDVGLSITNLAFKYIEFNNLDEIFIINNGAIAEQFAAQMFKYSESISRDPKLFYWVREKRGAEAEIDFASQKGTKIIPIEIKSGKSGTLKSLHVMMSEKKLKLAVRFDLNTPSKFELKSPLSNYVLLSLPIYLCERWNELKIN